jgi:hypothetical protein
MGRALEITINLLFPKKSMIVALFFFPSATLPAKAASVSITKLGVWPCESSPGAATN